MALSVSANKFNDVKKDLNSLNIKTCCTSLDYLKKKVQSLVKKKLKEQEKNKKMSGGYSSFIHKQAGGCNCNRTPKSEISGGCGCNYGKYMSGGMLGATVLPQRYFNPKMEGGSHGNGDYHITSYVDNTSIARAGIPSNFSGGEGFRGWIKNANRRRTSNNIQNLLADRGNLVKQREKERIDKMLNDFDKLMEKKERNQKNNNGKNVKKTITFYNILEDKHKQFLYKELLLILEKNYYKRLNDTDKPKFQNFVIFNMLRYIDKIKDDEIINKKDKAVRLDICNKLILDAQNLDDFIELLLRLGLSNLVDTIINHDGLNNIHAELYKMLMNEHVDKLLKSSTQELGIENQTGGKSHKLRIKKYNILTSSKMTEADIKVANKMSNTILSYVVNYLKVHKKLLHKEKPLLLTQKIVKHIFDDMNKDRNFKL